MSGSWIVIGAVLAAVSVAAGAFGAHALEARLDPRQLTLWETGARYLMYAALAVILYGLAEQRSGTVSPWPGLCLALGGLIFAGTLFAMSLGAPRWLGAVTPLGGLLLIAGFVLFAWTASRLG